MALAARTVATTADTIAALSSPPGGAEQAVVRVSGPRAWELAGRLFAPRSGAWPPRPWTRVEGALRLPGWPDAPAVAVAFRAPRSYTGQDVVELWVPGAMPLVRRLLLALEHDGARPAQPGEFTRRAFLAGRLDLTQAEAVLALTTGEDAGGVRAALRALSGGVGSRVDAAKTAIIDVLAHVEAAIDFAEEEIDHLPSERLAAGLDAARADLRALARACGRRPQAGAEPVVALAGPANAGKSSLLNALAGRDVALVSPVAGTTRDVVEAAWRLPGGHVVRLLDTAGEKEAQGDVEARALDAARAAGASADLVLRVVESCSPEVAAQQAAPPNELIVLTKIDLVPGDGDPGRARAPLLPGDGDPGRARAPLLPGRARAPLLPGVVDAGRARAPLLPGAVTTSAVTGEGLDALGRAVERALFGGPAGATADLLGTARQEALLARADQALGRAAALLRGGDAARAELSAVDLEAALEALGELTGAVTTDDVLDRVFARFCIGK